MATLVSYEPRNSNATLVISLQAISGERAERTQSKRILRMARVSCSGLGSFKVWEGAAARSDSPNQADQGEGGGTRRGSPNEQTVIVVRCSQHFKNVSAA